MRTSSVTALALGIEVPETRVHAVNPRNLAGLQCRLPKRAKRDPKRRGGLQAFPPHSTSTAAGLRDEWTRWSLAHHPYARAAWLEQPWGEPEPFMECGGNAARRHRFRPLLVQDSAAQFYDNTLRRFPSRFNASTGVGCTDRMSSTQARNCGWWMMEEGRNSTLGRVRLPSNPGVRLTVHDHPTRDQGQPSTPGLRARIPSASLCLATRSLRLQGNVRVQQEPHPPGLEGARRTVSSSLASATSGSSSRGAELARRCPEACMRGLQLDAYFLLFLVALRHLGFCEEAFEYAAEHLQRRRGGLQSLWSLQDVRAEISVMRREWESSSDEARQTRAG